MNDSLSETHTENSMFKRKNKPNAVTIAFSEDINMDQYLEKDKTTSLVESWNANVTLNSSCLMDLTGNNEVHNIRANVIKDANAFQDKLDKISFLQHSNDDMITESSLLSKSDAKAHKRQTIAFNQDVETSPDKNNREMINSSINVNDYINDSPAVSVSNQPPKFVMRKVFTPITKNSNKTIDFDNRCAQQYQNKKQGQNADEIISRIPLKNSPAEKLYENSLSFSLSNIKKISLSPDSFSQLIPTEYKLYNFKQLNDEIERGKIQLFSKTPTTDRKCKENIHFTRKISEFPKERRTLFFEDEISESPADTSIKANLPLESDKYLYFTTDDLKQKELEKAKCRFSQADDILLDNTSFLTRAKLGDETASRSSSKRDITQFNDIEIFDETSRDNPCQVNNSTEILKEG